MKTKEKDETFDVVQFLKTSSYLDDSIKSTTEAVKSSKSFKDEHDSMFFNLKFEGNDTPSTAYIRFLPNKPNPENLNKEKSHILTIYQHWFRMLDGTVFVETCPGTIRKKCPICEYISPLWNGNEKDREKYQLLSRNAYRITQIYIVKNESEPETKGKVYLFKLHKKLMDMILERIPPKKEMIGTKNASDELYFDPFNPFKSATFKLKGIRTIKPVGKGSQKQKRPTIDYFPGSVFIEKINSIPEDTFRKIYKECIDLDEILEWDKYKIKSYEDLEKKFKEGMGGKLTPSKEEKLETIEDEVDEIEKEFDDEELKKDLREGGIEFDDEDEKLNDVNGLEVDTDNDDNDIDITEYLE